MRFVESNSRLTTGAFTGSGELSRRSSEPPRRHPLRGVSIPAFGWFLMAIGIHFGAEASTVVTWGSGAWSIPAGLTNVVKVSARDEHFLALTADGRVRAWGNGTDEMNYVPSSATGVVAIATGGHQHLALRGNGTVVAWGKSLSGQSEVLRSVTNAMAVAAGGWHSVVLRSDGTVEAWGDNIGGQTNVPPGLTNIISIAAGRSHSLALRRDGVVVRWGCCDSPSSPLPSDATNLVGIAAGDDVDFGLRQDGTVFAWGQGWSGETNIPSDLDDVVALGGGQRATVALRGSGQVVSWGAGWNGTLPAGLRDVVAVAAGTWQALAVIGDGAPSLSIQPADQSVYSGHSVRLDVRGAGAGVLRYQWQHDGIDLPDATNTFLFLRATTVADAGSYVVVVRNYLGSAQSRTAAVQVLDSAPLFVRRPANRNGYFGAPIAFDAETTGSLPMTYQWRFAGHDISGAIQPTLVLTNPGPDQAGPYELEVWNAAGRSSVTAELVLASVASWGTPYHSDTTNIPAGLRDITALALGETHVLALRSDGHFTAWGMNEHGELDFPVDRSNAVAVAAGYHVSEAVFADGSIWAAGDDSWAQLRVPAGFSNAVAIAAGPFHTVALGDDARVRTWGQSINQANFLARLSNVVEIVAGDEVYPNSLAILSDGTIAQWSRGEEDALTNETDVASAALGSRDVLILGRDGRVRTAPPTLIPAGASNIVAVAAGGTRHLALREDGVLFAWNDQTNAAMVPPGLSRVITIATRSDYSGVTMGEGEPHVTLPPRGRTVHAGKSTVFTSFAVGDPPLRYQWQRDGVDLPSANSTSLSLANVTTNDAGFYALRVSNERGVTTSRAARLTVLEGAPFIPEAPVSQSPVVGQPAEFYCGADGSPPLSYQWQLNGVDVPGATGPRLQIPVCTYHTAGFYTVRVSNSYGALTSAPVGLFLSFDYEFSAPDGPRLWNLEQDDAGKLPDGYVSGDGRTVRRFTTSEYSFWESSTWPIGGIEVVGKCRQAVALDPIQRLLIGTEHCTETRTKWVLWMHTRLGKSSQSTPVSEPLPDHSDGFWKLTARFAPGGGSLTGSATIYLSGGRTYSLALQSTTGSDSTQWRLAVDGTNTDRGAHLALATSIPDMTLLSLSGRAGGQQLDYIATHPISLSTVGNGTIGPWTNGQRLQMGKSYVVQAKPKPGALFSNWVGSTSSDLPVLQFTMRSNLALVANFVPNPFIPSHGSYSGLFYDPVAPGHLHAGAIDLALSEQGTFSGTIRQGNARRPFSGKFPLSLATPVTTALRTDQVPLNGELVLVAGQSQIIGSISNGAWIAEVAAIRAAAVSASLAGNYTLLLPIASRADEPAPAIFGSGFATVSIARSGKISLIGKLADGSPLATSAALAENGQWPFYGSLYGGRGSIFGWLTLRADALAAERTTDVLIWTKPQGEPGTFSPLGFTNEIVALSSIYVRPSEIAPPPWLTETPLVLLGGNLPVPVTNVIRLIAGRTFAVAGPNPLQLTLGLVPASGVIKGTFVHPRTGRLSLLQGTLLTQRQSGGGFFYGTNTTGLFRLGN